MDGSKRVLVVVIGLAGFGGMAFTAGGATGQYFERLRFERLIIQRGHAHYVITDPTTGKTEWQWKEGSVESKYTPGELLPVIGGPRDGDTFAVEFVLPFLDGGIPNSGWRDRASGAFYTRDDDKRAWVHTEVIKQ